MPENSKDPRASAQPCHPCQPFCGLGGGETLRARLLSCGLSLLELPQEQQPQPLAPTRP